MIVKCIGTCRLAKISKTQTGTVSSDHLGKEELGKMKESSKFLTHHLPTNVNNLQISKISDLQKGYNL